MGSERNADFYDRRLEKHILPVEKTPWIATYLNAAELMPDDKNINIVDICCGTGRFAKILHRLGYINYWGVDFSSERLKHAKEYVPDYTFEHGDVFDEKIKEKIRFGDVFILLETLEHFDGNRDREIIQNIPAGKTIIGSLPDFDSPGHARIFKTEKDIVQRYGDLVTFETFFTKAIRTIIFKCIRS